MNKVAMNAHPNPMAGVSLGDWQDEFWSVFGHHDLPLYDHILQLVHASTGMAEAVRRGYFVDTLAKCARVFGVLTTLVERCRRDQATFSDLAGPEDTLSNNIWLKYPNLCPYCGNESCRCPILHGPGGPPKLVPPELWEHVAAARAKRDLPRTLDEWVGMIDRIYGIANSRRRVAETVFHFMEEVGEVEVETRAADLAYRSSTETYPGDHWRKEIADVFSWMVCIFLHLRSRLEHTSQETAELANRLGHSSTVDVGEGAFPVLLLSDVVWAEYGHADGTLHCPDCGGRPCSCTEVCRR